MKPALDLVLGRPRVALSTSRLLVGEVTTPYGALPTDELVETAWQSRVGSLRAPAWLLLGRRDAPSGTIWSLAWCPPTGALPDLAEIVLPEAIWVLERLNDIQGQEGWHLRQLESPTGLWTGLWEGSRCEHLQPPGRNPSEAIALERSIAKQRGATEVPDEIAAEWRSPSPQELRRLSETYPEADLLGLTESVQRRERLTDRTAIARTISVVAVLAVITGGFGIHQAWQAHNRRIQQVRLESVHGLVDRSAGLESSRLKQVDSLRQFQDALSRSQAPDLVISRIANKTPQSVRLQVLAMESTPSGWRIRTEVRLPDWGAIQPFAQGLRTIPHVSKVSVANQSRQSDAVAAVLEIEGTWP